MSDQIDVQEFVQSLRDGAPPELPEGRVAKLIVDHLADSGDLSVRALEKCARDLDLVAEATSDRSEGIEDKSQAASRAVPQERTKSAPNVVSRLLIDNLQPEVEELRVELFGSPGPPFPSFQDAAQWIEAEGEQGSDIDMRDLNRGHEIIDKISVLADELSQVWNMPIYSPTIERVSLSYINPMHRVYVCVAMNLRSRLLPIKRFIIRVSSRTGFSEESLVEYILTGTPPNIPELAVTTSYFRNFDLPPVDKIEIRTENFRKEDVVHAFKALQRARGGRKAAPLDTEDHLLIEAMRRLGGIPSKRKSEFWDRVSRELGREGVELSADAARMRWYRLPRKGISRSLLATLEQSS